MSPIGFDSFNNYNCIDLLSFKKYDNNEVFFFNVIKWLDLWSIIQVS